MATESGGDETGDETGGPGDETGDKTAATAGDERDGGDRWGNVYGRRSPSDDDEGVMGRLSDVAAAAAYRTNPNLPD